MTDLQIEVITRVGYPYPVPNFATEGSAGIDLYADIKEPIPLGPGECKLIPTGLRMHLKDPFLMGAIFPRSGLGHKHGIVLGNGTGIIDADYQGEIHVSLFNRRPVEFPIPALENIINAISDSDRIHWINPGDRIAQMVFLPIARPFLKLVDSFSDNTERGSNGFGSTGN